MRRSRSKEEELDADPNMLVLDASLLRSVSLGALLLHPSIFQSSQGDEKTFKKSQPCEWMHNFLSHAWDTPGWLKVTCLMCELNIGRATLAAFAIHLLQHVLVLAGVWRFPIPPMGPSFVPNGLEKVAFCVELDGAVPCVVFLVVLRWGQFLPLSGKRCFLDKCCIHQVDAGKKEVGIRQIGAVLRMSERLVILWQPEFFTRLWCMYELAAFLHINRGNSERVAIRPLKLDLVCVGLFVFTSIATLGLAVVAPLWLHESVVDWVVANVAPEAQYFFFTAQWIVVMFGIGIIPAFLFWPACRWHMGDRRTLLRQIREFRVSTAQCQKQEDRVFIESQIADWFGDIESFERYVNESVAAQVERLLSEQPPIPYRYVVVGSLPHVFVGMSLALTAARDGNVIIVWNFVLFSFLALTTDSLAIAAILHLADHSLTLSTEVKKFWNRLAGPIMAAFIKAVILGPACAITTPALSPFIGGVLVALYAACTLRLYSMAFKDCSARLCAIFFARKSSAESRGGSTNAV